MRESLRWISAEAEFRHHCWSCDRRWSLLSDSWRSVREFIFPKNRSLAKLLTHRNTSECSRRVLNISKKRVEAQERAKQAELREQLFELGWPTNLLIYAYHFIWLQIVNMISSTDGTKTPILQKARRDSAPPSTPCLSGGKILLTSLSIPERNRLSTSINFDEQSCTSRCEFFNLNRRSTLRWPMGRMVPRICL